MKHTAATYTWVQWPKHSCVAYDPYPNKGFMAIWIMHAAVIIQSKLSIFRLIITQVRTILEVSFLKVKQKFPLIFFFFKFEVWLPNSYKHSITTLSSQIKLPGAKKKFIKK